ncbi:hypothetical protein ALQ84_02672 [Pseudomonas caricapapayae]|uniref:Uncharacterized protein n=2 Tax=Pseudomonas caricapapayae TaxID=46678 RepID=A0A3M3BHD0_9PSED|nr:hypothetical protein ALQ84_02672 [Pseudomonas caricapapayae]
MLRAAGDRGMSHRSEDLSILAEKLQTFLTASGWVEGRQAKGLRFFYPPAALGIEGKYSIALPDDSSKPGVDTLLHAAADSLLDLYGYSRFGEMVESAASNADSSPARISSRFVDSSTRWGAMPLLAFGEFLTHMGAGLYESAKFKLGGDNNSNRVTASTFANECLLLQTKVGSFIASIEVPRITLRQADLFGHEAIDSNKVCSSLFSAIEFLNARVLNDTESLYTEESMADAISLFDVELLEALSKIILGPGMDTIEFSLETGASIRTSSTGWITEDKITRLKDYVAFVKKYFRGEDNITVTGSIVELRSRDPEGNRNYIRVVTDFQGERTFMSAILTNEQYQRAVDAHRTKRSVTIRGNGMRLKTQIRITNVADFTV